MGRNEIGGIWVEVELVEGVGGRGGREGCGWVCLLVKLKGVLGGGGGWRVEGRRVVVGYRALAVRTVGNSGLGGSIGPGDGTGMQVRLCARICGLVRFEVWRAPSFDAVGASAMFDD